MKTPREILLEQHPAITPKLDAIRAGETGQIVDVVDKKDGEHVEVFLE